MKTLNKFHREFRKNYETPKEFSQGTAKEVPKDIKIPKEHTE